MTDSNKTSSVSPLKIADGQVLNGGGEKAKFLNNTFIVNAELNDNGNVPHRLEEKTISSLLFGPKLLSGNFRILTHLRQVALMEY